MLANPQLRAALTDTAVAGPARRAVMLDLLEGKVTPAARRLAAFACMAVEAPEVPSALGWVSTRVRHLGEGQDEEPGLSLLQSRRRVGGFATAVHEDMSTAELESLEDDLFRFARIVEVDAGAALRTQRSRSGRGGAPGPRHPVARGKVAGDQPGAGPLRRHRGPGPGRRRHAGLPGGTDRPGPGLAHRPRAVGGADRRRPALRTDRVARHPGRRAGGVAGRGRRVTAQWRVDPDRRPPGGRHGAGTHRRTTRALRTDRLGAGRIRPEHRVRRTRQREQSDGRAHD